MAFSGSIVSPQYLHDDKISVTILEVKSPAHYVVKESAGVNSTLEAKLFLEAENQLQEFFRDTEPTFFPMPLKDAIVVVSKKGNFYRGRVVKIICMSEGYLIRVYLVDYGYECSVTRNCMYQIPEQFLKVPFQAVELKLNNIIPITLVMDPDSLEIKYGPVDEWDPSALSYVNELKEGMVSAHMTVKKAGKDFVSGSLFMTFQDDPEKCINDDLVLKKYAQYTDLDVQLEDMSVNSEELQRKMPNSSDLSSTSNEAESLSLDAASYNNHARLSKINQLIANRKMKVTSTESSETLKEISSPATTLVKSPNKKIEFPGSQQSILNQTDEVTRKSQHFTSSSPMQSKPVNDVSNTALLKASQSLMNPSDIPEDKSIQAISKSEGTILIEEKGDSLRDSKKLSGLSEEPGNSKSLHDKVSSSNVPSPLSLSNTSHGSQTSTQSLEGSNSLSSLQSVPSLLTTVSGDLGKNVEDKLKASGVSEPRYELACPIQKSEIRTSPDFSDSKTKDSCSMSDAYSERKRKLERLAEQSKIIGTSPGLSDSKSTDSCSMSDVYSQRKQKLERLAEQSKITGTSPGLSDSKSMDSCSRSDPYSEQKRKLERLAEQSKIIGTSPGLSDSKSTDSCSMSDAYSEQKRKLERLAEQSKIIGTSPGLSDSKSTDSCSMSDAYSERKRKLERLAAISKNVASPVSDSKSTDSCPMSDAYSERKLERLAEKSKNGASLVSDSKTTDSCSLSDAYSERKRKLERLAAISKNVTSPVCDSKAMYSSSLIAKKTSPSNEDFVGSHAGILQTQKSSPLINENQCKENISPRLALQRLLEKNKENPSETKPLPKPVEPVSSESLRDHSAGSTSKPSVLSESDSSAPPPSSERSVPLNGSREKTVETEDIPENSFRFKLKKLLEKKESGFTSVTKIPNSGSTESTQGKNQLNQSTSPVAPHSQKSVSSVDEGNNLPETSCVDSVLPPNSSSSDNVESPVSSSVHCSSEEEAKTLGKRSYVPEFDRRKFFKPKCRIELESTINRKTAGVKSVPLDTFDVSEENQHVYQEVSSKQEVGNKCETLTLTDEECTSEAVQKEKIEERCEVEVKEKIPGLINEEEDGNKSETHTLMTEECLPEALPLEKIEERSKVEVPEFINEEWASDKSLWDRQGVPALCLGKAAPKPILSLSAMAFPLKLVKILDGMKLLGPSSIQSVLWPAMSRGRSIVAIAPPHSGKTVGFLLPLAAKLFDLNSVLENNAGPIAVIVCSSWMKAQTVYNLLKSFLKGLNVRILLYVHDGGRIEPKMAILKAGCEILITVPSYMLEFLKNDKINIDRCTHFILDDGNNLLSHNKKEMKSIMQFVLDEIWRTGISHLKFVLCAERWTKTAAAFVKKFMEIPLMFFTSFLEAAIYSKIPIHPHVCNESTKNIELLKILETSKRAIVCTTNCETASNIHGFLRCENVRSYLVNETQEHYISDGVIQDWKSVTSYAVPYCLIISDNALSKMSISDANCLIHYDIPEVSRLQFGNRFSSIAEHFPKQAEDAENRTCESHILMTEDCTSQALPLMRIVERSEVEVPQELLDLINTEERKHADSPLCNTFKAFSACTIPKCPGRHFIDPVRDEPKARAKDGDVDALITHVFDASHFVVRILNHLPLGAEDTVDLGTEYLKISFALKRFYSCEANKVVVENPVVGGHYVYQEGDGLFYRVKVLSTTLKVDESPRLMLLFEDEGWVKDSKSKQLYEYDDSLDLGLPHAVEVFLSGISTPDNSFKWHPLATSFMRDLVENKEIIGRVALCLEETLWLNPVIIKRNDTNLGKYKNLLTLGNLLVNAEYAVLSQGQLQNLHQASQDIVPLPKTEDFLTEPQNAFEEESQIRYSFLPLNEREDVYVSSVVSPHLVYVQRIKFTRCLDDLLDDINGCIKENSLKKCRNVLSGMHCIAPFSEDDRYYRAMVTDVMDGNEARVFFVDFGDSEVVSKELIYVLPSKFLLLPFQAIECELNGICAPHGGWTEKTRITLNDLTRDEAGDMQILQLMAYSKSSRYEGGQRYVVDLWSCEKTVSDQLLEAGLVNPAEKATPCEVPSVPENVHFVDESDDESNGYTMTDEEDMDPEDKEMKNRFIDHLYKLMTQGLDKPDDSLSTVHEDDPMVIDEKESEKTSIVEKVIEIHPEQTSSIEEVIEINPVIKESPAQRIASLLKSLAKKKTQTAKPFMTWWDSEELVTVVIHLRDLEVYDLELYDTGFQFKASLRGVNYKAEESLYSNVHSNDTKTLCNVEGLTITFHKQETGRWPRLLKDSTKQIHIKYDMNHIDYSDSEDESDDPVPIIERSSSSIDEGDVSNTPDEDSSPDVLDDCEEECSVEPWRDFSSYRDPYDPLH